MNSQTFLKWISKLLTLTVLISLLSACAWLDTRQRTWIYRPTPGTLRDWQPITPLDEAIWLGAHRTWGVEAKIDSNSSQDNSPPICRPIAQPMSQKSGVHEAQQSQKWAAAVNLQPTPPKSDKLPEPAPLTPSPDAAPPYRLRAIWIPSAQPKAPAVLYLHGTFRNLFQNRHKIASIHAAGLSVLAVDYRGWGESTPQLPSEASIMEDAELAWAELQRREPIPARRIIFGHSMGSGVAVELALRHQACHPYGAVVLESALTSMPDVARDLGGFWGHLAAKLTTQRFDSIHKIQKIQAPKWFLSGTSDRTVPPAHTQRLFDAAREPKQLIWFEGGTHSELNQEFEQQYLEVWRRVSGALRP